MSKKMYWWKDKEMQFVNALKNVHLYILMYFKCYI